VYLTDDPPTIMRKFKRAVTDSETEVRYDPVAKPGVSNLLEILGAATRTKPADLADGYTQYGRLKTDTGEAVVAVLEPIQQRYAELLADRAELSRLLRLGSAKARAVASQTIERAYTAIGLLPA
jgi:tryptophanyl-tRNA synthetase